MTVASTTALITGAFSDFGTAVIAILTLVIGMGLAYLVFRFGWKKVKGSLR